jgi:catechol 2,3-dioxygenase-like lactoylglutathione lyase family enzyme
MNFQGVVINVADLNRSIDFYREVLDFRVLSQKEQLAAVSAPGSDPPQVIVLREFASTLVGGGRHTGLRALSESRASWTPEDFSSAGTITASGLQW